MKRKSICISSLALGTIAAGSFYFVGNIRAQQDTGIGDSPYLRAKKSGTSTASSAADKLSDKDKKFLVDAASGGFQEVADGKMAEKQGQSAEVRKIGARMVADHSKANKEVVELAKKKGLGISTEESKPRAFDKANFDRQYLANMERDHQTDIKLFEKEANSGDDPEIKAWALKTLATLRAHLTMVKNARK